MVPGKDSRGSEWRKWDLHLHTPGTKQADGFGGTTKEVWDEYCRILHDSDVFAFGITDYFSADGYLQCISEYSSRYPASRKLFLPNIELRTCYVVNKAREEVQLHIVFNPQHPDHKEKMATFLRYLCTNETGENSRVIKASELGHTRSFEAATTSREYILKAFEETYGRDAELDEYLLVVTAAGNDGIRPERGVKRKASITDELDKFSDGFYGNSGNTNYFLKTDRYEDKAVVAKPKPVFSASDAHTISDLENYLGKVFVGDAQTRREPTWVKADLTFEGLRQTLFEPSERVFIGAEPEVHARVRRNETRYIESLYLTCKEGYANSCGLWFDGENIKLSKELVAIVGNKGSGKSAIADVIGLLGNTHNQMAKGGSKGERLFSFLNDQKFLKGNYANNFVGKLLWYGGDPDEKALSALTDEGLPEKVEYLPQKYLERICANVEYAEFEATLNEVIFGYVREDERHKKRTFDDLIKFLSQQADESIREVQRELHAANEKVAATETRLTPAFKRALDEKIRLKREELASHSAQPPSAKSQPAGQSPERSAEPDPLVGVESELEALDVEIKALQRERRERATLIESLSQARQAIERETRSLLALKGVHKAALEQAGIQFEDVVKLEVNLFKVDEVLSAGRGRIAELNVLLQSEDQISLLPQEADRDTANAASLIVKFNVLTGRKAELIDQLGKPEREYQAYLIAKAAWERRSLEILGEETNPAPGTLRELQEDLKRIAEVDPYRLREARAAREKVSSRVFQEKCGLIKFYDSIKTAIESEIAKHGDDLGDYAITIQAGLSFESTFYEEFFRNIAQNAKGSFYGKDEGRAALQMLAARVTDWQSEAQVIAFINGVVDALHTDNRADIRDADRGRSVSSQLRERRTSVELYDHLFGFEYLRPRYALKVDDKNLSELSPGERGGLLLVFYLMLDRREIPLVIDQPEDNLDNKSVYEILVKFLKKAKKRRQIIIVTHNPNLAVVADAEQIIRVFIDKKKSNDFDFVSGAIENPVINSVVVEILEGTRPAFDNRRLKYRR
jgi:ABC-type lipoprotein export system ATPase subunit